MHHKLIAGFVRLSVGMSSIGVIDGHSLRIPSAASMPVLIVTGWQLLIGND